MKICIMGKLLNMSSGYSTPAFVLARRLASEGNDVTILSGYSPSDIEDMPDQYWNSEPFKVITVSDSLLLNLYLKKTKTIDTIKSVLKGTDVLHLFDYIPPRLIRSCAGASFPIIYMLNHPYRLKASELLRLDQLAS